MVFLGLRLAKLTTLKFECELVRKAESVWQNTLTADLLRTAEFYRKRAEGKVCANCPFVLKQYLLWSLSSSKA